MLARIKTYPTTGISLIILNKMPPTHCISFHSFILVFWFVLRELLSLFILWGNEILEILRKATPAPENAHFNSTLGIGVNSNRRCLDSSDLKQSYERHTLVRARKESRRRACYICLKSVFT